MKLANNNSKPAATILSTLRNTFRQFWAEREYSTVASGGVLSPTLLTEFNLSAGHRHVMPALMSSAAYASPARLSTIERCLRRLDMPAVGYSPFHLSLFEMVVAARIESAMCAPSTEACIRDLLAILDLLGLDRQRLLVTYPGTEALQAAQIDSDPADLTSWLALGLTSDQLVATTGRQNIVISVGDSRLHGQARPVGFTCEVFYRQDAEGKVLPEIASLNVYSSVQRGTIISKALNRVTGVGIGLERISAVIGGLGHVFDLPPLAAIAEAVAGRSARHPVFVVNRIDVYRLADRLRTIVFALADGQRLDESPRSRLLVEMFRGAEKTASLLGLSLDAAMERALVAMLPHYESECPPLADMLIVIKDFCRHWREYPTRR